MYDTTQKIGCSVCSIKSKSSKLLGGGGGAVGLELVYSSNGCISSQKLLITYTNYFLMYT